MDSSSGVEDASGKASADSVFSLFGGAHKPNAPSLSALTNGRQTLAHLERPGRRSAASDRWHTAKRTSRARLSRWIVDRDVLSLKWSSRMMVPLFQFDRFSLLPHPAVGEVIRELAPVLGDWSLALWLVRPHALLGCLAPVVAFQHHAPAVVDAARAQRYLVCG